MRDWSLSGQNRCAGGFPLAGLLLRLRPVAAAADLASEVVEAAADGTEAMRAAAEAEEDSSMGCRMRRRALMNQLFTFKREK